MKRSMWLVLIVVAALLCISCNVYSFSVSDENPPSFCNINVEFIASEGDGVYDLFIKAGGYSREYNSDFYHDWKTKVDQLNGGLFSLGLGTSYTVPLICH